VSPELGADESPTRPRVADGVTVRYLDPAAPWGADVGVQSGGRRLAPGLAATVRMVFDERDLRHEEEWEAVFFPLGERFDAADAVTVDHDRRDFRTEPVGDVVYALGDARIDRADFFRDAERALEEHLFREKTLTLLRNHELKLCSRPGESAEDFAARCLAAAEDRADEEAEKLRDRFESRLETARRRAAQSERRVRELDVDVGQRRQQELVAGAGEVLSMVLGGRRRVRSLSGVSSRRGQTVRTQERLRSASDKLEESQDAIAELERECEDEIAAIWDRWKAAAGDTRELEVPLERTDVALTELILFWAPTR
jgi:phage shock protein A